MTETAAKEEYADAARELLRHTLATLAYRGGKAVRNAPASFADFKASETTRTPLQILAHIGDLMDWALSIAQGQQKWNNSGPLAWDAEVNRFHGSLKEFDDFLASSQPLHAPIEKLFQGPVADAFTHVGQICMLRRIAGAQIRGENYFVAEVVAGRLGPEQAQPRREFD
jgi:hypothetical protein